MSTLGKALTSATQQRFPCALALALTAAFCISAFSTSYAEAGKVVDHVVTGSATAGTGAGRFDDPEGVAYNDPAVSDGTTDPLGASSDGYLYVVDRDNNRIQVFDADGDFRFMFGKNVVRAGGAGDVPGTGNERQTVTVLGTGGTFTLRAPSNFDPGATQGNEHQTVAVNATGGTFTLSFQGQITAPIPRNASAAEVDAALEALATVGAGNVSATGPAGGPWDVEFTGTLGSLNVPALFANQNNLTGDPKSASVSDGQITAPIPRNASAAEVDAALEALATVGAGNVLVTGPAGGPFDIEFAGAFADADVKALVPDGSGLTGGGASASITTSAIAGSGFEICTTPADCRGGAPGSQAGEMRVARTIAINQQTGDLYVYEGGSEGSLAGNNRVQQFAANGTFIRTWGWGVDDGANAFQVCSAADVPCQAGISGSAGGQFRAHAQAGLGIAIDPVSPHHVFVAEARNQRVQEFTATGNFVRLWGWDVVSTGQPGDIGNGAPFTESFEICSSVAIGVCKSGETGIGENGTLPSGSFESERPTAIAIDGPTGTVYANAGSSLARFDSDESTPGGLRKPSLKFAGFNLATDPSGDLLFAKGSSQFSSKTISQFDLSVDPPSLVTEHLGTGLPLTEMTVDPSSTDYVFTSGHRVLAADDDGAPPATATLDQPLAVGFEVTFSGTVTPGGPPGIKTTYNFQYSKNGVNWITVPGSENPLGDGAIPIEAEDTVTGLEPNADYLVRLATRKDLGNAETYSPSVPLEFTTAALPPEAETVAPRARGADTAILTGVVNPNNSPTSYRFEWGDDETYGNVTPVPSGFAGADLGARAVIAKIGGLSPETTYHYRLVAGNGVEVSPGDTEVEGGNITFTTRSIGPAEGQRAWEMVTPPFKSARSIAGVIQEPRNNPNVGNPSKDGEAIAWSVAFLPLSDEVGTPAQADHQVTRRTPDGWVTKTMNTLPLLLDPANIEVGNPMMKQMRGIASSADHSTVAWATGAGIASSGGLLPTEGTVPNPFYVRRDGTGTEGFSAWLTNPETQLVTADPTELLQNGGDKALINDDGTAMVRWGLYRGVAEDPETPGDDDPSNEQQLPGLASTGGNAPGGATIYLQRAGHPDDLPLAPKDLVNECTGSGDEATEVPARVGSGMSSDSIGVRDCEAGNVTSVRGASLGGQGANLAGASPATAVADSGLRVFFQSPDGNATETPLEQCSTATAANTKCPPQLFVRAYDANGENPVVRWISRSRSSTADGSGFGGAMIPGQQIGLFGSGAIFQGASRDGRFVYFKTTAPLTPDDPNGSGSPGPKVTGTASSSSWDLYRYELPDLGQDPGDGTLTRISGGPDGSADPGTNIPSGIGSPLRFHSDDGRRAYFVTTAPIGSADATPPAGGVTSPAGTVGNDATRNLYLFDDHETGADRYRFIARLPFSMEFDGKTSPNACSSFGWVHRLGISGQLGKNRSFLGQATCFRGTPDGKAVTFITKGRLTADDTDDVADIYAYDAEGDELSRVSAPETPGALAYPCVVDSLGVSSGECHGDFGIDGQWGPGASHAVGQRGEARGWGGIRYENVAVDAAGVVSVFFETQTALVPEDTNGDYWDVYQWRAGELSLISTGNTNNDAWYSGNSLDGQDVFVTTSERIDPRELDDSDFDIYDARIGGGFPYTPPPTPCDVLAFECEVDAQPAPAPGAASTGMSRAGNLQPKPGCAKGKVKRKGRCVKPKKRAKKARSGRNTRKSGRAGR